MQHIVQIAFDFDDDKVTKSIEANVEKEVIKNITKEIEKEFFEKSYGYESGLKNVVTSVVKEVVEEKKDDIVKMASQMLCEKLFRSKAVKEADLEAVLNDKEESANAR